VENYEKPERGGRHERRGYDPEREQEQAPTETVADPATTTGENAPAEPANPDAERTG
jgi:hypothetical protein